jgi:hypothetical protein
MCDVEDWLGSILWCIERALAASSGEINAAVTSGGSWFVTRTHPPRPSTIERQIESPRAHAVLLGRVERLQEPIGPLGSYAHTNAPHCNSHLTALARQRSHDQLARLGGDDSHGLEGIDHKADGLLHHNGTQPWAAAKIAFLTSIDVLPALERVNSERAITPRFGDSPSASAQLLCGTLP